MSLRLFNTLSGREEEFSPLEPNLVRMYTCGPTVYDYAHIGNFRTFVFQDVLRRYLRMLGYELYHVMNITDVDDRTIRNAKAAGVSLREYTEKYTQAFIEDMKKLRLEIPERLVRATDHINEMVELINKLQEKGLAYASEGSVYFRISAFPAYGKLSKLDAANIIPGARVDIQEYEKEQVRDFVLWKAARDGEDHWDTRLGAGRPGWHIECSAMAMKYLGPSFDIHAGGSDLIFPHHENEIAQSEGATGQPFARFWLHCEHLMIDSKKMSKSLGNFYTLRELLEPDEAAKEAGRPAYAPEAIRYLLASVPYRKPLNFTLDSVRQAVSSIERLRNFRSRLRAEKLADGSDEKTADLIRRTHLDFQTALNDNLNTAEAMGVVFEAIREINVLADQGRVLAGNAADALALLDRFDSIFAVLDPGTGRPDDTEMVGLAALVEEKLRARQEARRKRDFAGADRIRDELLAMGAIIEDTKEGVRWRLK